ncbi:ABC transporter permease [Aeromicrobium duanguangcaii]|uniref:ABC transporter permease n=1 Tax=Aeromicrobium duanguangcaii TaxID=2968086 RepID=UPI002017410C|nr:ABC transporter permease subunit [Aeromicrobium duanguangcaii]
MSALTASAPGGVASAVARGVGKALGNALLVAAIVYVLWVLVVALVDNPFVAKGPGDVAEFLFTGDDATENRTRVMGQLGITLRDAAIGFTAGMVAAVVLAGAIVLSRGVEATVMPVAMVLRAVPLIALAPVIRMIFGRGVSAVAVISGIVVLFPAVVGLVFGLRSSSRQMHDVVQVYGGSERDVLFKVSFPSALPSLFAAIRISVPGAITGALIAEWLATGKGIGYAVVSAAGQSKNNEVWALVIVVTVVSLLLYTIAQVLETFVLARYGKDAGRA